VEVVVDGLKYAGQAIAILPIISPYREEIAARRMEAFPYAIVALEAKVFEMTGRTFPLRPRTNGNAVVFEENLGDGTRRHGRIFPDTTPWRTLALLAELSNVE
jgi:hypothetical protein